MGHGVIKCVRCGASVMEGHNDWSCDCGAYFKPSVSNEWIMHDKDIAAPFKECNNIDELIV